MYRAKRIAINIDPSLQHAKSVGLLLSLTTGLVSPQFHVKYDDLFETVRNGALPIRSLWQHKAAFIYDPPSLTGAPEPSPPTFPLTAIDTGTPDTIITHSPVPDHTPTDLESETTPDLRLYRTNPSPHFLQNHHHPCIPHVWDAKRNPLNIWQIKLYTQLMSFATTRHSPKTVIPNDCLNAQSAPTRTSCTCMNP
jgi:hypothetical protein